MCKFCRFKEPLREEGKVWCSLSDYEEDENYSCNRFQDIMYSPEMRKMLLTIAGEYEKTEDENNSYVNQDDESQNNQNKEGCYIATAVYGSYDASEVMVLRKFRDEVLKQSLLGRMFIRVYYATSPQIAKKLKNHHRVNKIVRIILDKMVLKIRNKNNNEV